jgi:hypothetical protein
MKLQVAGLAVLIAVSAWADVFNDSTGDIDAGLSNGAGTLDILSVEVTHDATDVMFSLTVGGDVSTTDWGKFMIGIATGGTGSTTDNGWGRPITLDSPIGGMDFWIGSWVDGGGGAQLWSYNGATWDLDTMGSYSFAGGVQSTLDYSVPLATLGLGEGDTFYFDVYASGGGGTDTAIDALSNPNVSVTAWDQAYVSSVSGGGLSSYGVAAIPEPGTLSLFGFGVLSVLGLRRRRR